MTTPVQVRTAVPADTMAIVRVVNDAFEVESFFKNAKRTDADGVRELMSKGTFLVAGGAGDALIGSVFMSIDGERGYFGMLSVDPASQGGGVGRALQAEVERRCRDAGCRVLEIHVVDLRTELPPYYERLGFNATGETLPFPSPDHATQPCHLVVMSKPLA